RDDADQGRAAHAHVPDRLAHFIERAQALDAEGVGERCLVDDAKPGLAVVPPGAAIGLALDVHGIGPGILRKFGAGSNPALTRCPAGDYRRSLTDREGP